MAIHEFTTGHFDADNLLGDVSKLRERIADQAETLAAISRMALASCGTAAQEVGLLADGTAIEKFLTAQALANIMPTNEADGSIGLDQLAFHRFDFDEPELASIYLDHGYDIDRSGFPPSYFSQDLIKWADELAKNGWSVLAQMNIILPEKQRSEVTVYPDSERARELLDERDRAEEASQWLSERVFLHTHPDDLVLHDWTGTEAAEAQSV